MNKRSFKQGDIIFIPFPFTNLQETKKRPALIISNNNSKGSNYIVAKITSNLKEADYSYLLSLSMIDGNLKFKSEVRTDEIFTINESIIIRKICSVKPSVLKEIIQQVITHLK